MHARHGFAPLVTVIALTVCTMANGVMPRLMLDRHPLTALEREKLAQMIPLQVHVGGRVVIVPTDPRKPRGTKRYLHQWPGVYFETAFIGDAIAMAFDDTDNAYRIWIDKNPPIELSPPGQAVITIRGLTKTLHRIRLEQVSESIGPVSFDGFYARPGTRTQPIVPLARAIEFIGASPETGYGIRRRAHFCTQDQAREASDTQSAYAATAARALRAEYKIVAVSGRGLIRNYAGVEPNRTMARIYPLSLPYGNDADTDKNWQPGIVVLDLLSDFATPLKPGEPWQNLDALIEAYGVAFRDFAAMLHQRYPKATLLVKWPDTSTMADRVLADKANAMQPRLAAIAHTIGMRAAFVTPEKGIVLSLQACNGHPDVEESKRIAASLVRIIDAHPEYWPAK